MKTAISKKSVYLNVSFEKYTHQKLRIEIRVEECLFKRNDRFCMAFFFLNFLHGLFATGLCGLDTFSICNSIRIFGDKKAQFGKMHVSNRKAVFKNKLCYK